VKLLVSFLSTVLNLGAYSDADVCTVLVTALSSGEMSDEDDEQQSEEEAASRDMSEDGEEQEEEEEELPEEDERASDDVQPDQQQQDQQQELTGDSGRTHMGVQQLGCRVTCASFFIHV
jgi:hypothetical protein